MSESKKPASTPLDPRDALAAAVMRDAGLRDALRQDPRATIKRVLGIEVPGDVEVEVLEETPRKLYLVLPAARTELSDEELDQVVAAGTPYAKLSLASTRMVRAAVSAYVTDVIRGPTV